MAATVGSTQDGVGQHQTLLYPLEYLMYEFPNERQGYSAFTVQELRDIAPKHKLSNGTKKGVKQ